MSLLKSILEESRVTGYLGLGLLSCLGDEKFDATLDSIRRQSMLDGKQRISDEAQAWLEFSRATGRFYDRLGKK